MDWLLIYVIHIISSGGGRSSQEGSGILTHQYRAEATIHFMSVFRIGGVRVDGQESNNS